MNKTICAQDFKSFYRSLSVEQREAFASAANTTTVYIETHLVYARKIPRRASMDALWQACVDFGATFTREDLLAFFFAGQKNGLKPDKPKAGTTAPHPEAA